MATLGPFIDISSSDSLALIFSKNTTNLRGVDSTLISSTVSLLSSINFLNLSFNWLLVASI